MRHHEEVDSTCSFLTGSNTSGIGKEEINNIGNVSI